MNAKSSNIKIISSVLWKALERVGTQGIQFIVQILLARLLLPEDYGLIALITIFITFANVFVQRGFNNALIQKKKADDLDFSSVFYVSLIVAVIIYLILFLAAPLLAVFYDENLITPIIRVLALSLFIGAFNSIQYAYVARNMMFKKLFLSSLIAVILSGIVSIILAYVGFGVWSLVTQQLLSQVVILVVLWYTINWRPKLIFSLTRIKELFKYGSNLLAASILHTLYGNLRNLIVGSVYNSAMLGFFSKGSQLPLTIINPIDSSLQAVMFPTLSSYQDDRDKVKSIVKRYIKLSSFVIFPLTVGLAVVAEPLVKILLTEVWLPIVPFLQIFCISFASMPFHSANLQTINALGRSDIFFRLEIIKKILGVFIIFLGMPFGVFGLAWGSVGSSFIAVFINSYPNGKLINYKCLEQVKDIFHNLLIALLMGFSVYLIGFIPFPLGLLLATQIATGIFAYILLSLIFKNESFNYIFDLLKNILKSKNKRVNE